ncbi:hypothetical protein VOI32_17375 [Paraburkholderia caribensis]|uniref:Uncharacterized protein n=1 Tax=Paraburkholderia caribensis TaxID=75105 RepID=A0A9Q6S4E3_9BURK|nr:hypothetical protein [Paraburkholderia caribensis]MCO4877237.1 hypothetical protein [Paraburkholderia caribensis]PTB28972.1 hypothetical protein C9I56_10080 [Paraburkholderia caribensis]QLB64389.1 hypothetical protein A9O66_18010 [Paraburkholderia caribensis]CAG9192340.1 conserved hypothetical protein [Paraburkholderia caribensis]
MHWIDPDSLPETRGTVTRFLLNPHGELDGLVLGSRQPRQVHFPPHLSRQIARHVAVGDEIRVRGVKPRSADMIAAVSVTTKTGKVILDEGPHHDGEKHQRPEVERRPMQASGEVVLPLFGPKGELRGALLDDGTSLRMPPHAAAELASYLMPKVHVQAWGHGIGTRHGRTIEVDEIAELVDAAVDA